MTPMLQKPLRCEWGIFCHHRVAGAIEKHVHFDLGLWVRHAGSTGELWADMCEDSFVCARVGVVGLGAHVQRACHMTAMYHWLQRGMGVVKDLLGDEVKAIGLLLPMGGASGQRDAVVLRVAPLSARLQLFEGQ